MSTQRALDDRRPVPLRPDPNLLGQRDLRALIRCCLAHGRSALEPTSAIKVAERQWPDDPTAKLLTRATSAPATIASTRPLATTGFAFLQALAPLSAAGQLLASATVLHFEGRASISAPGYTATASVGFVQEAGAAPVGQMAASGLLLTPTKLAMAVVLTEEMLEASQSGEELTRAALLRSGALGLDAALFDANPASAARPAGLLNGLTSVPPSTATPMIDAMAADLSSLAAAVKPVGGRVAYVVAPERLINISVRLGTALTAFDIFGTAAVASNDVVCVAYNGLVAAIDDVPEIKASKSGVLHMETQPNTNIIDTGPTLAVPVRSLWQTRAVALSVRFPICWGLRAANAVSWVHNVKW
jgi:hypothetical protein